MRVAYYILFLLVGASSPLFAQKDIPYYETIEGDSVRLFLESVTMFGSYNTSFTSKECARGYRCTRISADGKFEGEFADILLVGPHQKPMLMAHGTYAGGKKEGKFTFYYQNGHVMTEGQYRNDEPIGEWHFNSPNGVLVLTLLFDRGLEPRIQYMFDDKTQLALVKNGNGEARFVSQGFTPYAISGRVKSGLPDGEWIGEVTEYIGGGQVKWIRKETYREGKMTAGKKYQSGRITDVCCTPELTWIFPTPVIDDLMYLEEFPIQPCAGPIQIITTQELPAPRSSTPVSSLLNFESNLKAIIRSKYQGRQVGEGYSPGVMGNEENQVIMHFNTNEDGRPVKTRLVSAYGREFYAPIKRALETLTKWQPNQSKLVLTVYIRMGISTYSYRYQVTLG